MLSLFRDQIAAHFNLRELQNLCFDLEINFESLPGETLEDKARELVGYCKRHGNLHVLVEHCQILRPHMAWVSDETNRTAPNVSSLSEKQFEHIKTPDPVEQFEKYRFGNIELPVMNLFGSPESPFEYNEVRIQFEDEFHFIREGYPHGILKVKEELVEDYKLSFSGNWRNNPLPRLEGYIQSPETSENRRGRLLLKFSKTDFFHFLATNRSLETKIPVTKQGSRPLIQQTIRDTFVTFPYQLEESILANTLGANMVLLSKNLYQKPTSQVIIRYRGDKVALYQNCYQVSASGFTSLAHRDDNKLPNPFVTAVTEANEEIADNLQLKPSNYKLIGIAVNWKDLDLNAYGFAETGLSVQELRGDFRRDAYEGTINAIPFDPETVLEHIAQNKWEPISVLAMIATLLAYFPRKEVEILARMVPAKYAGDFDETNY